MTTLATFTATDALTLDVRQVNALAHPDAYRHGSDTVYAVFSDEAMPEFMGLVSTIHIARNPDRIFADLIPNPAPLPLAPDTPLEMIETRLHEEDLPALPVMDGDCFVGAVTSRSLMRTLLNHARMRTHQGGMHDALSEMLFEHPLIGVCLTEGEVIARTNACFAEFVGRDPESLPGRVGLADLVPPQDWIRTRPRLEAGIGTGTAFMIDFPVLPSGEPHARHLRAYVRPLKPGNPPSLLLSVIDRTGEYHAEERMKLASLAFDCASEGVMITDHRNRILAVNNAFTRITGYRPEDAVGRTPAILRSGRQDEAFYDNLWDILNRTGRWEGDIWNRRKDGKVYPEWLRITAAGKTGKPPSHYIGTFHDISWQKDAERHIEHLSYHDPLTGLPNRRQLGMTLARICEQPEHERLAVLFIDIDRFKEINDGLGHATGDRVLQVIAERLTRGVRSRSGMREPDFIGRYGGDEFLVVACCTRNGAAVIAEHLLEIMREPITLQGHPVPLHLGASIGIALAPDDSTSAGDLLRKADLAMLEARRNGHSRMAFYSDRLDHEARNALKTRTEFRHAMDCEELMLVYQPQISLVSGRITGLEALLRWRHPERGLLAPDVFGHLLDQPEYSSRLLDWTLETACMQGSAWQRELGYPLRVAINLSPAQFHDKRLEQALLESLRNSGLAPESLELEITETSPMTGITQAGRIIEHLRALGIRVALDDFGTGYSALNYLRHLPIHTLKIDREFIAHLPENGRDASLVGTITRMAHQFGLEVVAEGVETRLQAGIVKQLGCDTAQGFLYCRPLPPSLLNETLKQSFPFPSPRSPLSSGSVSEA